MLNRDNAIWEELLAHLRSQLSEREFNTWFTQVKPVGIQEGSFVIGVAGSFARDWIRDNYLSQIEAGLKHLGADMPRVGLQVLPLEESRQQDIFALPEAEYPQPTAATTRTRLNTKYRFESFVVGSNNNLAYAAAQAITERPGQTYNPLFLYGDAGLGKTHLMHAVGHEVAARFPKLAIEYVTTEAFTNDLINAIREKDTNSFRERYRSVDLLLVDDVQFIAGKEQTQEEFFHTFNSLYEAGKQIILSSDRPPKNIPTLENRLRSRFEWGLITDIQPPEFETRVAILEQNAQFRNVKLPTDVAEYIARQATSNIRELEGALVRVIVYVSMNGSTMSVEAAANALSDVFETGEVVLSMDEILRVVGKSFGIDVKDLRSKGRRQELVVPRQLAMYLIREHTQHSFPEIGQFFSGRDHSTVMYSITKFTQRVGEDGDLQRKLREIRHTLGI